MPGPDRPRPGRRVSRDDHRPSRPLAVVAAEVKAGAGRVEELFESFVRSRLYLPRPPAIGLRTLQVRGRRVVPVFSSEEELARFAGRVDWFSTDGLDLLGLVPTGMTIGLDMAAPHRLQLDPAAVRLDHAVYLRAPGGRRRKAGSEAGPRRGETGAGGGTARR